MKMLELALFVHLCMRMLLVHFFNLNALTCIDNQAHRAQQQGTREEAEPRGRLIQGRSQDVRRECVRILHPRKDILFFQDTSALQSKNGMLGIQSLIAVFQPPIK